MTSSSWLPVVGAIGAVLGACIAGAIGFASSWYSMRKQSKFTELTLGAQEVRLFNERFSAAADKLGHEQAATRLAGVYAFAGLADDWEAQRQTCIDVLCGYMRLPYVPTPGQTGYKEGEKEVRHSLIRIIRDHLRENAKFSWQGCIFRFHHVTFDGGDLSSIRMSDGYMSFYDAQFVSGLMDFRGARFSGGTTDFLDAKFLGGTVDFRSARFSGGTVKFPRSHFSGAVVDLRKASFTGAVVDFGQALFSGGTVDLREPAHNSVPPRVPDPLPAGVILLVTASNV